MATNRIFTGSTKDILDLRKTVENQAIQLQAHQEEIKKLKDIIQSQQEKYCFLLDSNSKLWTYLQKLEKQIPSTIGNEPVSDEDKENIVHHSKVNEIKKKKYKEREAKIDKIPLKKKNKEENQVAALNVERTPETLSEVQRFLNAHPSYAKEIGKVAKNHRRMNKIRSSESEEEESESERRQHGHHHHHKNHDIVEKITLERKVYKKNNIRDYLSSTIDDTLEKFDISPSNDHKHSHRHHHRENRRQHLPSTPTIKEVTSSESDDDDYVEEPKVYHHHRGKNNHDSTIEATTMPDEFDDDDMSSDTESSTPKKENPRRQRVGDRLRNRRI